MAYQNTVQPQPMMEWVITDLCNYKCPYCLFPNLLVRYGHCSESLEEKVFDVIEKLEGQWLIKLIGGEPMFHPHFNRICERIRKLGHRINVNTNFSLSNEKIEQFITACGDNLEAVTISLHESQIKDIDAFVEKIVRYRKRKSPKSYFTIACVVTVDNFERLKQIDLKLQQHGPRLHFQVLKNQAGYTSYPRHIEEYISGRTLKNLDKIRNKNFRGHRCYAGKYYFRIHADGNVFRCNNYQPYFYLGNIKKGTFKPLKEALPCLSKQCTCTSYANLNLIAPDRTVSSTEILLRWYPLGLVKNLPLKVHYAKKFFVKRAVKLKKALSGIGC